MTKEEKVLVLKLAISVEYLLEKVESSYLTEDIQDYLNELRAIAKK